MAHEYIEVIWHINNSLMYERPEMDFLLEVEMIFLSTTFSP